MYSFAIQQYTTLETKAFIDTLVMLKLWEKEVLPELTRDLGQGLANLVDLDYAKSLGGDELQLVQKLVQHFDKLSKEYSLQAIQKDN